MSPDENNDWLGMVLRESGISIDKHPLKDRMNMHGCGASVCADCGKFTARSFNEND